MTVENNISNAYRAIEVCEPSVKPERIELRQEQKDAVKKALARFNGWAPTKETKYLWNAKMRFGKTVSALQLAKEMSVLEDHPVKRTIIVTHRPDVQKNWREDFEKIFTEEERKHVAFATKFDGDDNDITSLIEDENQALVFFASMQYLRGSTLVGGKKSNPIKDKILKANWDLVVVDEAHEDTLTDLGSGVIDFLSDGHKRRFLSLSGTPFNLFESFANSEIFTWDYVQEQERKLEWPTLAANKNRPETENPYRTLPKMEIRILKPEKVMQWKDGFDLREFFRIDDSKKARENLSKELSEWKSKPKGQRGPKPTFRFVHEEYVKAFLSQLADDTDPQNSYPFANLESRTQLRHSFWVLPGVKECQAMKALLESHPDYNDPYNGFKVINVAGTKEGDEESANALDAVRSTIKELTDSGSGLGTITLSCGRLTTGVTVPQWTAVIYLKGSTSTKAATYMQTIFRVQSPWEFDDNATGMHMMKKTCYVFDFDPQRTLSLIAETAKYSAKGRKEEVSERAQTDDERTRDSLKRFLDLCQVCDMSGQMIERDTDALVQRLVEHLHSVAIERAVTSGFDNQSIYNFDNLLKADPEKMERIRKITGETDPEAKKDKNKPSQTVDDLATVEKGGKTPRGKKELTEAEIAAKEAAERLKKEKDKRVAILRGIAIRIPLMMYGAEGNYESTITLDNITNPKVVDRRSWDEFMPKGVTPELFEELKEYFDREVFDGAGRRYRELTREADSLPPTERVTRIAEIQSWFRNPNSETVLTPWKVVNRHLSDTIGGYCFYNEQFTGPNQEEVEPTPGSGKLFEFKDTIEPRWVNREDVTERVFRVADGDHSTLLEINSKSGLYPLYLVYTLYRLRLDRYLEAEVIESETDLSLEEQQVIWDDAVSMCVHIICNSPMAEYITRRTLLGFRQCTNEIDRAMFEANHPGMIGFPRNNLKIRNIDLVEQARDKTSRPKLIETLRNPKFWNSKFKSHMPIKFDAIVGNPPYQDSSKNNHMDPVYHHFLDLAYDDFSTFATLITPGRFLFGAGDTPDEFNKRFMSNPKYRVVAYSAKSQDFFQNVIIKGGVAITMSDEIHLPGPIFLYTGHKELHDILLKVKNDPNFKSFSSIVYTPATYKFSSVAFNENILLAETIGRDRRLRTNIFEKAPFMFTDEEHENKASVSILGLINNQRITKWIKREYVDDNVNISKYKLFVAKANGSGLLGETLSMPVIGCPNMGHSESFISIGAFESKEEAYAVKKYISTKITRALLGTLKVTQDTFPELWANVPLQDFTSDSDVPWDKSVAEIDQYLYKKYGLSQEEIDFIESMIKPME